MLLGECYDWAKRLVSKGEAEDEGVSGLISGTPGLLRSVERGASATRVRGSGSNGSCLPFDGNTLSRSNEAWNYLEHVSVQIHDHLFV